MLINSATRRSFNRESGQILVMTAVSMVALLAIAALSLDASFMYDKRNRLHAAADAAAKSAAIEVVRQGIAVPIATLQAFADQQVIAHGFTPTSAGGTTTVLVEHAPGSGPFAGNPDYVEVTVSEPTSTFFGKVVGWTSMTPGATAVAGPGNPVNCLIAQGKVTLGNSVFTMNGCGVAVGSILVGSAGATINGDPTPTVSVTLFCTGICSDMGNLRIGAPKPTDPLAGLPPPANPGGCIPGVSALLVPGCYTSIAATVKNLAPGLFYVTGDVDINSVIGTEVTIYLAPGAHLTAGVGKSLHLTAPTTGPYRGVAIFQDASNPNNFDVGDNFQLDVTGTIYFPGTTLVLGTNFSFTGTLCTLLVAQSVDIPQASGTMTNTGCASLYGRTTLLSVTIAQ